MAINTATYNYKYCIKQVNMHHTRLEFVNVVQFLSQLRNIYKLKNAFTN